MGAPIAAIVDTVTAERQGATAKGRILRRLGKEELGRRRLCRVRVAILRAQVEWDYGLAATLAHACAGWRRTD